MTSVYAKIWDPKSQRFVSVKSSRGCSLLKTYITHQLGGAIRFSSNLSKPIQWKIKNFKLVGIKGTLEWKTWKQTIRSLPVIRFKRQYDNGKAEGEGDFYEEMHTRINDIWPSPSSDSSVESVSDSSSSISVDDFIPRHRSGIIIGDDRVYVKKKYNSKAWEEINLIIQWLRKNGHTSTDSTNHVSRDGFLFELYDRNMIKTNNQLTKSMEELEQTVKHQSTLIAKLGQRVAQLETDYTPSN